MDPTTQLHSWLREEQQCSDLQHFDCVYEFPGGNLSSLTDFDFSSSKQIDDAMKQKSFTTTTLDEKCLHHRSRDKPFTTEAFNPVNQIRQWKIEERRITGSNLSSLTHFSNSNSKSCFDQSFSSTEDCLHQTSSSSLSNDVDSFLNRSSGRNLASISELKVFLDVEVEETSTADDTETGCDSLSELLKSGRWKCTPSVQAGRPPLQPTRSRSWTSLHDPEPESQDNKEEATQGIVRIG